MVVASSGNVGIGTTGPGSKLEINGTVRAHSDITVQAGTGNLVGGLSWASTDNGQLYLNNGGVQTVNIIGSGNTWFNAGNVGIGTTSPGDLLDVGNTSTTRGYARLQGYNGTSSPATIEMNTSGGHDWVVYSGGASANNFDIRDSTQSAYRLSIDGSGNVGIGTTNPTYQLQLSTDSAGKPNGGSWSNSSDARLKTDIVPISNGLERLAKLNPVSFTWRNPGLHGGTAHSAGFVAQEVAEEFPQWVTKVDATAADKALVGPDGKAYSLTLPFEYDAMMVSAIKELQTRNNELEARIKTLEAKLK